MYYSSAERNSGARAKKKKREEPSPLAQATFDAFEPFINVFDPGLKLRDGDIIHTITKDDWKLFRRHKAGERPYHEDGWPFHPYFDVVRNIYGSEHVHRHIEKNEVTYYTSGQNGLGLLYLDIDAHHPWQTDEAKGRDLLEQLFPFGYFRRSGRGQNGYVKVRYSSIAEFNRIADCLEETLKRLFLHCGILCDIEVKGTITDNKKSGSLAKLPFSTTYGPELVHRADWAPWELELLEVSEGWCFIRLEQFKSKPTVNLRRIEQVVEQVEAQIDEEKLARFLRQKEAIKEDYEKQAERQRILDERSREEALAKRRAMSFSGLPSSSRRLPTTRDNQNSEHTPARPVRVVSREISKPITPPSERGHCDGNAFTRNQNDLLPFVRQFYKRHRRFPDVEDAFIHLRDNGLFSGQWEENEGRRAKRVGQILGFIEGSFDPKELSTGESPSLDLRLGRFSWWVRQRFGSGIKVKTADVRRFDPVTMTGPVRQSVIPPKFIETFLVVADFCLNVDPLDNKAVPTNRFKTLWKMVEGGACWNQRFFQIVRDRLHQAGVLRIFDRNHESGKAWRWDVGPNFPARSWKEEHRRLKERSKPLRGPALSFEELAASSNVVLNNLQHKALYQTDCRILGVSGRETHARPPPD